MAIESLRMRAEDFRLRAADSAIPHYSELMHKGAAHLEEQIRMLEARTVSLVPADFEMLFNVKGTDR